MTLFPDDLPMHNTTVPNSREKSMKARVLIAGALLLALSFTSVAEAANVMNAQALNAKQQSVVAIAAFTANGDLEKLKPALNEGLDNGLTINEIKEILVQLYAYAGFPRSLNALGSFMAVVEERGAKGITDEAGREPGPMPTDRSSLEFGADNQTKVVGQPVTGALYAFAPAIDQFLKAHLFGDIFQRDNLDWQTRELATIAALASIKGLNPQLRGHLAMGMNTGLTPAQLEAAVAVLGNRVGKEVADNAGDALKTVLNARNK